MVISKVFFHQQIIENETWMGLIQINIKTLLAAVFVTNYCSQVLNRKVGTFIKFWIFFRPRRSVLRPEFAKVAELSRKVINYNDKMKKHTKPIPREGYIACTVRDFYPDLRNIKHNDPNLQAAAKLGRLCHEKLFNSEGTCEINVGPSKSKYRKPGAGRRATIPDLREALFD